MEDADRRFYQQGETLEFEKIENEWPIFYLFMIIDGVFKDLPAQVAEYQDLMCSLVVREPGGGDTLVPMMYQVGRAELGQEREQPRSQRRRITQASLATTGHHQHTTFLWGQALHIIAELLTNRLVLLSELVYLHFILFTAKYIVIYGQDPIKRYLPCYARPKPVGHYSSFLGTHPCKRLAGREAFRFLPLTPRTNDACLLARTGWRGRCWQLTGCSVQAEPRQPTSTEFKWS